MRIALAAFAASSLFALSAAAADPYTPPQLPPPPPPPLTAAPPPASAQPAPAKGQPAPKPKAERAPASTPNAIGSDSPPAEESGDALDTRWALGAMVGLSTDYLNLGFGVRGGKTFASHIYVGGSILLHFAGDTYAGYAGPLGNYTSSASVLYGGPEGGYDFDLKAVVLRAYVGLGLAYFSWSVNTPGASASGSDTRFVVWPGATVIYSLPASPFFIGGDVRFVSVPGGPAVGFFAFGGIHFGS